MNVKEHNELKAKVFASAIRYAIRPDGYKIEFALDSNYHIIVVTDTGFFWSGFVAVTKSQALWLLENHPAAKSMYTDLIAYGRGTS